MTLIAAYRPLGVPVLLGDFLITGGEKFSTSKKIYRISKNFVVGWTGRKYQAATILRRLFEEFEDKVVTKEQVESYLVSLPEKEIRGDMLHIIGWIIDENPVCFLWNSLFHHKLFYEPYVASGSGSDEFIRQFTQKTMQVGVESTTIKVKDAILSTLMLTGNLYSDEMLERLNRKKGFGHGYEILYFDGNEFLFLDDVLFIGADFIIDPEQHSFEMIQYNTHFHYYCFGSHSLMRHNEPSSSPLPAQLIPPIINLDNNEDSVEFIHGSLRAKYYCFFFRCITKSGEFITSGVRAFREIEIGPSKYEKLIDGNYVLDLGKDYILELLNLIGSAPKAQSESIDPLGWASAIRNQEINNPEMGIEFSIDRNDVIVVVGMANKEFWDRSFKTIPYALMFCADSTVQIYENGIAVGPFGIPFLANDVFNIVLTTDNSNIKTVYTKNRQAFHISEVTPSFPMAGVVSIKNGDKKVKIKVTEGTLDKKIKW